MLQPGGDDRGALLALGAALGRPSPWAGFHPADWPWVLTAPSGRLYAAGQPATGDRVAPGLWGSEVWALPPGAAPGLPAAWVEAGPDLAADLWAAAFRLHLRLHLHREPPAGGVAATEQTPVTAALGELEDRALADALASQPLRLPRALTTLCLVRRERRGPLPDEAIAAEQAAEVWDGLPAYVAGQQPASRSARIGLGLAQLLDRVDPGWQVVWGAGRDSLDQALERFVAFDGGSGDEALMQDAQYRHDYAGLLVAAQKRLAAERTARKALVDRILRGDGSLLVVDTSALGEGFVEAATPGQRVNAGLSVWDGAVAFRFRGAEVFFDGVPVARDRRAGLLQARVRGRLHMSGDGADLEEPAEFTERLEMDLPGVTVRARHGWVRPLDEGLYVKLEPDA